MRVRLLSLTVLFAWIGVTSAADISRSFDVEPGGILDIDSDVGSIEVTPGADDKVTLEVDLSGPDADKLEIDFEQTSRGVRVKGRLRDKGNRHRNYTLRARFRAQVPARYDVRLDTSGGGIEVGDLQGEVHADTAGGSITVGRVKGPVRADTAGGSIEVESSQEDVDADTAGGSIRLGDMGGRVRADTAGGSIRIDRSLGHVKASTAGGSIKIRGASESVDASTSGGGVSVTFVGQPSKDSQLSTSGGNVTAILAGDLRFDIRARSGSRVRSEFDLEDERIDEDRLDGRLNGGGPRLRLDSSGPVRIERR
jgi:DUF4097 and DUF4098 domain-containing protein YvlB